MTVVTPKFGMGASVLRREDQAFIKGEGRYTDDISPAGLCSDRVNYVGDAVAFVVADSRALAQDAAEMIEVDYDSEDAAPAPPSRWMKARRRLRPPTHWASRVPARPARSARRRPRSTR